jgi:ParB family chromosome partitioning protein
MNQTDTNTTTQAATETITTEEATMENTTPIVNKKGKCRTVGITKINTAGSIRLSSDDVDEKAKGKFEKLLRSIKKNGVLTPIIVKPADEGRYNIVDGHRRLEAAEQLGYKKLQVISYEDLEDTEAFLSIIANTNRKALSPIELGFAYKRLQEAGVYENNKELAEALGVSTSNVSVRIGNLKLDKRIIKDLIVNNSINDQKVLKELRSVEKIDNEGKSALQFETYSHIVENELSRNDALEYIKTKKEGQMTTTLCDVISTPQFLKVENENEIKVTIVGKSALSQEVLTEIERLLEQIEHLSENGEPEALAA